MNDLEETEVGTLRAALCRESGESSDARYLHRLHCVLLVCLGYRAEEVASCFGDDRTTVTHWVSDFRNRGAEALREGRITGRPARLAPPVLKDLAAAVRRSPRAAGFADADRWNGKRVAAYLESRHGITLSLRQCQRLLARFRHKRRPILPPGNGIAGLEAGRQAPSAADANGPISGDLHSHKLCG